MSLTSPRTSPQAHRNVAFLLILCSFLLILCSENQIVRCRHPKKITAKGLRPTVLLWFPWKGVISQHLSVRLRQSQHLFRDVTQDELRRDGRDARDHDFAQISFHVILLRI